MKKYIAYYRVSTTKQGESGLGLQAQQTSVKAFLKCEDCIEAEFIEVESGKNDKRPQLQAALAKAKLTGATLVIAKLDRLSRNASFIFTLKDSNVEFVCADMPDANTLTIGIFAVMAQHERELISKRTKDALAAKKAKGEVVGNITNLTSEGRKKGAERSRENALNKLANRQAMEWAVEYKNKGMKLQDIANKLNDSGYLTSTSKAFAPTTVKRLIDRHKDLIK